MKKTLLKNLSANATQLILNQIFGLGIFYILSANLSKDSFGQISLVLAILLSAFNILSFGIDQVIIKKIAAGDDAQNVLSLYITHVLITGLLFYGLLIAGFFILPHQPVYSLLMLIGIGKLMVYLSTPLKQAANGLEMFKLLARLSIISNFVRCICLLIMALLHQLNLPVIAVIFIIGDTLELAIGIILFKRATKLPLIIKWDKSGYLNLVRESVTQIGVVLITSGLARFDWILIGFILSEIKLAEYSFAYKVFEMATLPLLAIAPLLIPRFTKIFKQDNINTHKLKFLMRMEFVIAALSILLLNIYWSPIIDRITGGKYGAVNANTIFILSLCIPLLYLENFLWTIFFAQGRLKMILHAFIITFFVNVIGDIILIPLYKNEGAALAFLLACTVQVIFYLSKNTIAQFRYAWVNLIACTGCALGGSIGAKILFANNWLLLPAAVIFYLGLLIISGQIRLGDKVALKAIIA